MAFATTAFRIFCNPKNFFQSLISAKIHSPLLARGLSTAMANPTTTGATVGSDSSEASSSLLSPPVCKGMTKLDKSAFTKEIQVPVVTLKGENLSRAFKALKPYLLKIRNLKPILQNDESESSSGEHVRRAYLNPLLLAEQGTTEEFLSKLKKESGSVEEFQGISVQALQLSYDSWSHSQVLDSVLPDDQDKVSSFSKIGHLIHLNLRDHHLPYKGIIGEILLEKVHNTKTVINKLNIIDNTFRNFKMELLAGEDNTIVTVKHSGCDFQFDFAHVYWNPRLGTEHERILGVLKKGDVFYDVFAGVGPFSVPAGKKKIRVLANDLNPHSFRWLQENVKKNKVTEFVKSFNLDGREFITTVLKQDLIENLKRDDDDSAASTRTFHVAMNLPALAVEFLDSFWGILEGHQVKNVKCIVHVYCFIKGAEDYKKEAVQLAKDCLGFQFDDDKYLVEVSFVRNVAPNKEMLRVSFRLPEHVLTNPISMDGVRRKRKISQVDDDS